MIDGNFDNWNELKKDTHYDEVLVGFKNRDFFILKWGKISDLSKMEREIIL